MMRMRNLAPANNVVLRTAIDEIQSCLPAHWSTSVAVKTNDASDARLVIKTPAGANAAVAIASKRQLDPSLVPAAADALKTVAADGFLVVSPFLGARTRERLLARGIGYVDLAGNVRLALDRPSILIDRQGQERNPWAKSRDMRSLDGPKASRLIRALCDRLAAVRRAAARGARRDRSRLRVASAGPARARGAGTPQPARLRRRGRRPRRDPALGDRVPLPRRRTARCSATTSAGRARCSAGCARPTSPTRSRGARARRCSAHQPLPVVVACYVDNPERAARRLDLPAVRDGANVVLLEPFDPWSSRRPGSATACATPPPARSRPICSAARRRARKRRRHCSGG